MQALRDAGVVYWPDETTPGPVTAGPDQRIGGDSESAQLVFITLPVELSGNASTISTRRGTL